MLTPEQKRECCIATHLKPALPRHCSEYALANRPCLWADVPVVKWLFDCVLSASVVDFTEIFVLRRPSRDGDAALLPVRTQHSRGTLMLSPLRQPIPPKI